MSNDDTSPPPEETAAAAEAAATPVIDEPADDFLLFLMHRAPKSAVELAERMREVVAGVKATGKKGTLTYKLIFKPAKDIPGAVIPSDDITASVPVAEREGLGLLLWADDEGALRDSPQNQTALPFDPRGGK